MNFKRKLISWAGSSWLQPFYSRCNYVLLRLMNYGAANHPNVSGEFELLRRLESTYFRNRENIVIIDAGANTGQYVFGATRILPKATVHCFEPSGGAFERLSSRKLDRVVLNNIGLGAKDGDLLLYSDDKGSVKGSLITNRNAMHKEKVHIVALDTYLDQKGIDHIDFLKMDVEGYELEVLKGATKRVAAGQISFIQFEFGGEAHLMQGVTLRSFFEFLPDFRFYRVLHRGLCEFQYSTQLEIYLTTNYLAVHQSIELKD